MAHQHVIEYAKSGRAKCHGPCRGTIAKGTVRYGRKFLHHEYGETTEWRHWECAQQFLPKLASVRLESVQGFNTLSGDDQNRIRQDVKKLKIAPTTRETQSPSNTGIRKRKAEVDPIPASSQSSQPRGYNESEENLEEPEDEVKDELYVSLPSSVVGLQYYKGMVGRGEEVNLVREPHNRYDINAIQVLNISGEQVGHVPRNVASKLASLLDRKLVTVEGVILNGNVDGFQYSISMTLKIYGPSNQRAQLEPMLIWATPRQKGKYFTGFANAARPATSRTQASSSSQIGQAGPSRPQHRTPAAQRKAQEDREEAMKNAEEIRAILSSLEKVDDEGRRTSILDSVCKVEDVFTLPVHPNPPSRTSGELAVDLLRHQSQALQWCLERENPSLPTKESDKPVQFWQYKTAAGKPKGYYLNIATHTPQEAPPVLGRGGVLADAMGLGKTLTMLATIIASKADMPSDHSNSTLIVAPLSVLSNWKTQIVDHCLGSLSHVVYYEDGRNFDPKHLEKFDVVITTYSVVVQDFNTFSGIKAGGNAKKKKKSSGGLFEVKWKRIVLDEGHTIRNHKTKMALAVRNLEAQRRWIITGTPIINGPRDLGSLLQFLRLPSPLDKEDYYKRLLLRPLTQGSPEGAELLRALMSQICIRRTKEMQDSAGKTLVPLPPVEMTIVPVQLDRETRALYDEMEAISQLRVTNYVRNEFGGAGGSAHILSLLTRLRQFVLHPGLLPLDYLDQLRATNEHSEESTPAIQITPKDKIKLQLILLRSIDDNIECPICYTIPSEPRITACAHFFCLPCISEVISRGWKCPMDRRKISIGDIIEPSSNPEDVDPEDENEEIAGSRTGSSAKIDQLVHLLRLTPKMEKSLVFSQFTGFLSKIEEALKENGIPYVRFDGRMTARKREEVLERFSVPLTGEGSAPSEDMVSSRRSRRPSTRAVYVDMEDDSITDASSDKDSFLDDSESGPSRKGKGKSKFMDEENPVVMLMSLKAGALGLNLTVANNVYLMDPWWQEGIESQAIDRCNRIGQTKMVHVYQLVAENTVESKVLEIQERKKALIKEAFSGTKNAETQRQKKEARLQDLIELFGIRENEP